MGKSGSHRFSRVFKQIIEMFGMEWREVSGACVLCCTQVDEPRAHRQLEKQRRSWRISTLKASSTRS